MIQDNQLKFNDFREKYSIFHYDSYQYSIYDSKIDLQFYFHCNDLQFSPKMSIAFGKHLLQTIKKEELDGLVFHIGMIELISYWKAFASPIIEIDHFSLSEEQQSWWKKLYWKGLGEFFYQNQIETSIDTFLNFKFSENPHPIEHFTYLKIEKSNSVIVPIGGGKDLWLHLRN